MRCSIVLCHPNVLPQCLCFKEELMVASIQDRSLSLNGSSVSLRKQPTFHEVATRHAPRVTNDVWLASAEIPYWWRVSTQILIVLLIGWNFLSTNQKHYQDLISVKSSVWNSCARYSDVVLRGFKWRPRGTSAVFSGYKSASNLFSTLLSTDHFKFVFLRAWLGYV